MARRLSAWLVAMTAIVAVAIPEPAKASATDVGNRSAGTIAWVSGNDEWFDLRDDYTRGDRSFRLAACWEGGDAGSPVFYKGPWGIWHEDQPSQPTAAAMQNCSSGVSFNASRFPEGAHSNSVGVLDTDGDVESEPWTIYIDRTPPRQALNFDSALDPESQTTLMSWDPVVDPQLPDGSPGSGTRSYRYRYQRGTGGWTNWEDTANPWFALPHSFEGEAIGVDVQAIDAVGNIGTVIAGTARAEIPNLTPENMALLLSV